MTRYICPDCLFTADHPDHLPAPKCWRHGPRLVQMVNAFPAPSNLVVEQPAMPNNQEVMGLLIKHFGLTRHDTLIPGRADPYIAHNGALQLHFKRPGVEGEFRLQMQVDHIKPFTPIENNEA